MSTCRNCNCNPLSLMGRLGTPCCKSFRSTERYRRWISYFTSLGLRKGSRGVMHSLSTQTKRYVAIWVITRFVLTLHAHAKDALKALVNAHDKLLRGRKVVVTYANEAPNYDSGASGSRPYHRRMEMDRPTTLSLLKSNNRLTKCVIPPLTIYLKKV
jgi:hypothetical protein